MFSDECDVFDFSLNDSNVNSISLWFLPMLLSSAVNSSRLCWHQSCEISTRTVMSCLPPKIQSFHCSFPISAFFYSKQEKKRANVTLSGSGQGTVASISLALPMDSDHTIYSAGDNTSDPHKCCMWVCSKCVFMQYACVCLSVCDIVVYVSLLFLFWA